MIEALGYLWRTIELSTEGIVYLVNIINLCLSCSIYTGKFIVNIIFGCWNEVSTILATVIRGITIMYDDSLYFFTDLQNIFLVVESLFRFVCESAVGVTTGVYNTGENTIYVVTYSIFAIKNSVTGIYRNGVKTIYDWLLTFKGALILVGNVIWMGFTLIPGLFVYVISLIVFFINKCTQEIISISGMIVDTLYNISLEVYYFITDMPVEAIFGLFVGFGLIYLGKKYKIILSHLATVYFCKISKFMQETSSKLLIFMLCFLHGMFIKFKCTMNRSKEKIHRHLRISNLKNSAVLLDIGNESLCVVCQDNVTDVVIMPCKHMCLCKDCSNNPIFNRYNGLCPMCRCLIGEKLVVYR